jgi:hypothetical protein
MRGGTIASASDLDATATEPTTRTTPTTPTSIPRRKNDASVGGSLPPPDGSELAPELSTMSGCSARDMPVASNADHDRNHASHPLAMDNGGQP